MSNTKTTDYPHKQMDEIAVARYRVVEQPTGFWGFGVVAGDGTAVLYKGHKKDCELVAQRMMGAFLDGGIVAGDLLAKSAPEFHPV